MTEAKGNPRIAPTAYFTAQAWVAAGFENAELFSTPQGRLMYGAAERIVPLLRRARPEMRHQIDYLWVRHSVYETRLEELKPGTVVEIGAGLSPRGLTFARRNPDLLYIEGDLPHMVEAKRRALSGTRLPPNYLLAPVDLLEPGFAAMLPAKPVPGRPLAVITEGVTDYLDFGQKRLAFENIARLIGKHGSGRYLFEVHARELFGNVSGVARFLTGALGLVVGTRFDDRLFESVRAAQEFVRNCGFDSAGVMDLAHLNRSPVKPPLGHCPYRLIEAGIG